MSTNLVGKVQHSLIFNAYLGKEEYGTQGRTKNMWECLCVCGNTTKISACNTKQKSCGCAKGVANRERLTTHNKSNTSVYNTWLGMLSRCNQERNSNYFRYGGRGIKVCTPWHSFEIFAKDMGDKPGPDYSIERIDNNGNYCPTNCVWATRVAQANNRRTNNVITYGDKSQTLEQWAKEYNIKTTTLFMRLYSYNWTIHDALTKPVKG